MKNTVKNLLPLIGLFVYQSQVFAQAPDYSGTWVLNNEKSKLQSRPDGMTSSVFIIKQVGNNFSLTIHHIFGDAKDTIIIKMLADGKTRQVLSAFKGKLERKENYLQITLWKKGFLDKVGYKFGDNKNEFVADEVLISDSDNHHNIWVFDREFSR
ncbi:MAG: hypothetical protein ABUT20_34055 [Bacteroidota bacterium]